MFDVDWPGSLEASAADPDSAASNALAVAVRWLDPDGDGDPTDGVDGWRRRPAWRTSTGRFGTLSRPSIPRRSSSDRRTLSPPTWARSTRSPTPGPSTSSGDSSPRPWRGSRPPTRHARLRMSTSAFNSVTSPRRGLWRAAPRRPASRRPSLRTRPPRSRICPPRTPPAAPYRLLQATLPGRPTCSTETMWAVSVVPRPTVGVRCSGAISITSSIGRRRGRYPSGPMPRSATSRAAPSASESPRPRSSPAGRWTGTPRATCSGSFGGRRRRRRSWP